MTGRNDTVAVPAAQPAHDGGVERVAPRRRRRRPASGSSTTSAPASSVVLVAVQRALSGAGLDDHVVPEPGQLADQLGDERDTRLALTGLPGDCDPHLGNLGHRGEAGHHLRAPSHSRVGVTGPRPAHVSLRHRPATGTPWAHGRAVRGRRGRARPGQRRRRRAARARRRLRLGRRADLGRRGRGLPRAGWAATRWSSRSAAAATTCRPCTATATTTSSPCTPRC